MAANIDKVYFVVSPDPTAGVNGVNHYQDNTGAYFYVKFGDGGGNGAAYRRANPNFRLVENNGVDPNSQIEFPDPGSGRTVKQRFAKYLEKALLVAYNKAHGGGSEWYKMKPVGPLTYQQLGQNLSQLLTAFGAANLETSSDVFIKNFEVLTANTA